MLCCPASNGMVKRLLTVSGVVEKSVPYCALLALTSMVTEPSDFGVSEKTNAMFCESGIVAKLIDCSANAITNGSCSKTGSSSQAVMKNNTANIPMRFDNFISNQN